MCSRMGICSVLNENRRDLNRLICGIVDPGNQSMKGDLRFAKADFEGWWSSLWRWISCEAAMQNANKQ